jgi:very-short-patch-repair endonuclease
MTNQRPSASRSAIDRARQLRRDSTTPERILWRLIRGGRLGGLKFRRQHPIGPFFADYYCHEAKLVVELDGTSHDGRADADRRREAYLRKGGLTVLRIGNDELLRDLEAVAMAILRAAGRSVESGTGCGAGSSQIERENDEGVK